MSEPRISTAICHLLLAGSSAWTCRTLHNAGQIQWAYGTLGLYFAKSVVGVLRYGSEWGSARLDRAYEILDFCCQSLCFNLFLADLYSNPNADIDKNFAKFMPPIHIVLGLIPVVAHFINKDVGGDVKTGVDIGCVVSGATFAALAKNYYAASATALHGIMKFFDQPHMNPSDNPALLKDVELIETAVLEVLMACALTNSNVFSSEM